MIKTLLVIISRNTKSSINYLINKFMTLSKFSRN